MTGVRELWGEVIHPKGTAKARCPWTSGRSSKRPLRSWQNPASRRERAGKPLATIGSKGQIDCKEERDQLRHRAGLVPLTPDNNLHQRSELTSSFCLTFCLVEILESKKNQPFSNDDDTPRNRDVDVTDRHLTSISCSARVETSLFLRCRSNRASRRETHQLRHPKALPKQCLYRHVAVETGIVPRDVGRAAEPIFENA